MQKHYYSVESLEVRISAFEKRHGMTSEAFLAAPDAVPSPDRTVWATLFHKARELRDQTEASAVTAALLPAS